MPKLNNLGLPGGSPTKMEGGVSLPAGPTGSPSRVDLGDHGTSGLPAGYCPHLTDAEGRRLERERVPVPRTETDEERILLNKKRQASTK
jgi:hypothetical protein